MGNLLKLFFKVILIIVGIFDLLVLFMIVKINFIDCGSDTVCQARRKYHPDCGKNGAIFLLKRNKEMDLDGELIPANTFYYLQPDGSIDPSMYINVYPIKIANFNGINLEEFVDKTVCIEGKYRFGLPTFFIDPEKLPVGMSEYEQVAADIERIELR